MSATGLEVFDKTLQTTHIWLNEIGETVGPDKQRCYHALTAVLQTLRDRLTIDHAAHLSAQLPLLVRGLYYDGYRPADAPLRLRSREEFIGKVAERVGPFPIDPEAATQAVIEVLARHLPPGEIEQIKQVMPEELRTLFETSAAKAAKKAH